MKPELLWESIFSFDTYSKGGKFSASDISGEPLIARLRKEYGSKGIKWEDKISSFIGTAIHERIELFIKAENDFGTTNMESEVKLKFKTLSGTCDLILDGKYILDWKTGSEKNIQSKIRKPEQWVLQLSVYAYLLHKERNQPYQRKAYIGWLCTDTQKRGILELELLELKEITNVIKEFMAQMKSEPQELPKCKLCIQFMHRWCGVRDYCPYWQEEDDMTKIDDW